MRPPQWGQLYKTSVIGKRARHPSWKQASWAGMKLYYKGMLAVHLENGTVSVRETVPPARPPGFALLRLLAGGICNTDLELQRGYYGFRGTPGHEFVAEVVAAERPSLAGKRVVGEINLACTRCDWCRRGL